MEDDSSDLISISPADLASGSHRQRLLGSAPRVSRTLAAFSSTAVASEPSGEPPEPPIASASTPDIAFQVSPCPSEADQNSVVLFIRQKWNPPNPDVRSLCANNNIFHIGIWLGNPDDAADEAARNRGNLRLALLQNGETFGVFINASLIRGYIINGWNMSAKRLNGDGQPDPNGPVHLTGLSISFESPDRIVGVVDGFDERPWPDVDFHVTITVTLSVSEGAIQCSSDVRLDTDTSFIGGLTGIASALGVLLSPVFFLPAAAFLTEDIFIGNASPPDVNVGAACNAVAMLPEGILLPGAALPAKIALQYDRAEVTSGGVFVAGKYLFALRTPRVFINGPLQISTTVPPRLVSRVYSAPTEDLREPITYMWSADGTLSSPSTQATWVRFAAPVDSESTTKNVTVTATDDDGLSASASVVVEIDRAPETGPGPRPP